MHRQTLSPGRKGPKLRGALADRPWVGVDTFEKHDLEEGLLNSWVQVSQNETQGRLATW